MNEPISIEEYKFLSNRNLFTEISKQVKSPRARRPGAHVSAYYVSQVLKGCVNTNTDTAIEVINRAKHYINTLLINREAKII